MSETTAEFIRRVLDELDLSDWTISPEGGGGGCIHPEGKSISLGIEASYAMALHEVTHIGFLEHDKHWASRFTDLVERFLNTPKGVGE